MTEPPRRLLARHPVAVDAVVAVVLLLIGEAAAATARPGALHATTTAIAVLLVAAAVAVRRPWPVVATSLVLGAVVFDAVTGGKLSRAGIGWVAVILVGYSAGAHAGRRQGPIALVLLLAAMTIVYVGVVGEKGTGPGEWLWELGLAVAPYGVGRLLRARRRLHAELEDRALALTHEREVREQLAVGVERARIARELHDVAAHSLSVMVIQVGAARSVLMRRFASWHAPIQAVLEATPDDAILRNDVYYLDPLPLWSRGRIVLLGDAAHATTPGIGQGAAQALEDAVALADALDDGARDRGLARTVRVAPPPPRRARAQALTPGRPRRSARQPPWLPASQRHRQPRAGRSSTAAARSARAIAES